VLCAWVGGGDDGEEIFHFNKKKLLGCCVHGRCSGVTIMKEVIHFNNKMMTKPSNKI